MGVQRQQRSRRRKVEGERRRSKEAVVVDSAVWNAQSEMQMTEGEAEPMNRMLDAVGAAT